MHVVRDHKGQTALVAWLPLAAVSIVNHVADEARHILKNDPKHKKAKKCLEAIAWIAANVPVRPAAHTYHDHMFATLNPIYKKNDAYAIAGVTDWVAHKNDGIPTQSLASMEEFQRSLATASQVFQAFKDVWTFDQDNKAFVTINYSLGAPQLHRLNKVFKKFLTGEYVLEEQQPEQRVGAQQMYSLFSSLTFTDTSEREILQEGYVTNYVRMNSSFANVLGPLSTAKLFDSEDAARTHAIEIMKNWPIPYLHVVAVEVAPAQVLSMVKGASYIGVSFEPSNNEILERVCAERSAEHMAAAVGVQDKHHQGGPKPAKM